MNPDILGSLTLCLMSVLAIISTSSREVSYAKGFYKKIFEEKQAGQLNLTKHSSSLLTVHYSLLRVNREQKMLDVFPSTCLVIICLLVHKEHFSAVWLHNWVLKLAVVTKPQIDPRI